MATSGESLVRGTVARIGIRAASEGDVGLPKRSVPSVRVERGGLEGDFNHYRHERLHDEADSAVLLLPADVLTDLARDGWPVRPGDLGENLLLEGVPNAALAPGASVAVGPVHLVVTRRCDPCTNLYRLPYVGDARGPAFLRVMMGRRGWYARVDAPGTVTVGAPVAVHPVRPPSSGQ